MTYLSGRIQAFWNERELEDVTYFNEPFNDPVTIENWEKLYGKIYGTGLQADYRSKQPTWTSRIIDELAQQGIVLDKIGTSYYKMMPGDILPYHRDIYTAYCRYHGVKTDQIWRTIVFMNDWQPGFLFEIEDEPIVKYRAGTWITWHADAPHMAGNLGTVPRYTLQITGMRR